MSKIEKAYKIILEMSLIFTSVMILGLLTIEPNFHFYLVARSLCCS